MSIGCTKIILKVKSYCIVITTVVVIEKLLKLKFNFNKTK